MSIPAQVFGEAYPSKILPGQLFKFRDSWALRVAHGNQKEIQGFVLLEGDRVGRLFKIGDEMPRCLAIMHPFTWFPSVDATAIPQREAMQTATLTLGSIGPVIIGCDLVGNGINSNCIAFDLDGRESENFDADGSEVRFAKWSVELQHPSRPFESLGTLLLIDRQGDSR